VDVASFQAGVAPAYKQYAAKFGQATIDKITQTK
jgi:hypothetical protein